MKKLLLIATGFVFVMSLFAGQIYAQGIEEKEKVVALVYDDSGSMREIQNADKTKTPIYRWLYANYALQSFIGLLGERDSFFYVPMSQPNQVVPVNLASEKRQEEMNAIRKWNEAKNTPFESVATAIHELKTRAEQERKKEYWLIVLTDGAFNKLEEQRDLISKTLKDFTKGMKEKGIGTHAVLITIESKLQPQEQQQMELFKTIWKEMTHGIIIPSEDDNGIIDSINQVAAMMANRDSTPLINDGLQVKFTNNEALVTSLFPLTRLTIVQQSNSQQIVPLIQEVRMKNKSSPFRLTGPFETITPPSSTPGSPLIHGYLSHITGSEEVLSPGVYTIKFNTSITDKNDLAFLGEPALDYAIALYRKGENGKLSKDAKTFFKSSPMMLEVTVLERGTNKPLSMKGMDVSSLFSATVTVEGKEERLTWNEKRQVFQYEFSMPSQAVTGTIDIRVNGLYKQTKEIYLQPMSERKLEINVLTKNWSQKVSKLENSEPIILQPTVNGQPITTEELKKVFPNVQVKLSKDIPYELKQKNNQLYVYICPDIKGMLNVTKTGHIHGTVEMKGLYPGEYGETDLALFIQNTSFIERNKTVLEWFVPTLLTVLGMGFLAIGWIVRPRFNRKALLYFEMRQALKSHLDEPPEPELLVSHWFSHYIGIPYRAERKTIQSLHVIARKGTNSIWVAKETQVSGMVIDGSKLEEEDIGKEYIPLYPNQTVIIDRGYCTEVYRYECD